MQDYKLIHCLWPISNRHALEALKAGLNGHRVLATLHASSIKEAISRLWAFLDEQGDELLDQSLQGTK
jgi:type II secretory ATPase GspE/PulE/Tfp pilus assembly ATPase PilB-like protein